MPGIVGITGGIGSGKSTVCRIFQILGIAVYNADSRSKQLTETNEVIREKTIELLGPEAYLENIPNRPFIASKVFADKNLLASLNAIIHPVVAKDFEAWANLQTSAYVLKEAAILIESGGYRKVQDIILVTSPKDIRIKRLLDRDKTSEEQIAQRMKAQLSDEEKMQFAHFVVENNSDKLLIPQVLNIHEVLLKKYQKN